MNLFNSREHIWNYKKGEYSPKTKTFVMQFSALYQTHKKNKHTTHRQNN